MEYKIRPGDIPVTPTRPHSILSCHIFSSSPLRHLQVLHRHVAFLTQEEFRGNPQAVQDGRAMPCRIADKRAHRGSSQRHPGTRAITRAHPWRASYKPDQIRTTRSTTTASLSSLWRTRFYTRQEDGPPLPPPEKRHDYMSTSSNVSEDNEIIIYIIYEVVKTTSTTVTKEEARERLG